MHRAYLLALGMVLSIGVIAAHALPIEATIATHQRYGLYIGSPDGSDLQLVGSNADAPLSVGPLNGPGRGADRYAFELTGRQQVYLVVWGGQQAADGLLAEFAAEGIRLMSGDGTWRVFRSGMQRGADEAPLHPAELRRLLREANVRNAWNEPQAGERNDAAFGGIVSDIDPEARWMWVRSDDAPLDRAGSGRGECLVFRTMLFEIWPEIEAFSQTALGGAPFAIGITSRGIGPLPMPRATGGGGSSGGSSGVGGSGGGSTRSIDPPDLFETPDPIVPPMTTTRTPRSPAPVPAAGDPTPDPWPGDSDRPAPPMPDEPHDPPTPGPQPVPEPSSLLLLLSSVLFSRRR